MSREQATDDTVRNIQIRQTYLEERTAQIQNQYNFPSIDDAFLSLTVGLLFDIGYDAIEADDIVDGGQDKQIDVIRVQDEGDIVDIHIVQTKNSRGFSSNALIQMRNGLSWIFERPKSEYSALSNRAFVNRIDEIRQLRLDKGSSNINVSVYYITMGDTDDLSDEFMQERKILIDKYSNAGFNNFIFQVIGAFELGSLLDENERARRAVNGDVSIIYDVNRASLIEYDIKDTKAVICTVRGAALAALASTEPMDAIFDLNVRPYYGTRGRVNRDIESSCTSELQAHRFWFLNNGVTLVCDQFSVNKDPDSASIKVRNAQIVNGCQTTVTLREAWKNGALRDDVNVLLRIYATDKPDLIERITLTTNSQNRITDRDLRANDDVQRDIQRAMQEQFGYFYERKNKEFRYLKGDELKRVIPNYRAAQAYLAIVRRRPSLARGYLAKIWSDQYTEIFQHGLVEDFILSHRIYSYCSNQANLSRRDGNLSPLEQEVAVYGSFHLARIIGFILTRDKWGAANRGITASVIAQLEMGDALVSDAYAQALAILVGIRRDNMNTSPNPTLYFKAGHVESVIEQHLAKLQDTKLGRSNP